MWKHKSNSRRLLVSVALILLAGIAFGFYSWILQKERVNKTREMIDQIQEAVWAYEAAYDELPDPFKLGFGSHTYGSGTIRDKWGTPILYTKIDKDTFEIRSAGPDKIMYTKDDLTNDGMTTTSPTREPMRGGGNGQCK